MKVKLIAKNRGEGKTATIAQQIAQNAEQGNVSVIFTAHERQGNIVDAIRQYTTVAIGANHKIKIFDDLIELHHFLKQDHDENITLFIDDLFFNCQPQGYSNDRLMLVATVDKEVIDFGE